MGFETMEMQNVKGIAVLSHRLKHFRVAIGPMLRRFINM